MKLDTENKRYAFVIATFLFTAMAISYSRFGAVGIVATLVLLIISIAFVLGILMWIKSAENNENP